MDSEDKKKLDRLLILSEANNHILKKLLRNMRWGRLFRITYWVVIIGASIGAFYFFQPYLDELMKTYNTFQPFLGT